METIRRFVVLLSLLEKMKQQNSWCGETHLQKSVYFLQTMLNVPLGFEYIFYKHGPFSFELRDELAAMRGNLLLTLEGKDPYGPSFAAGPAYDALKDQFEKTWEEYSDQLRFVAEKISQRDVTSLERLATALYVTQEMHNREPESRAIEVTKLKSHISLDNARSAIDEVDQLTEESRSILASAA